MNKTLAKNHMTQDQNFVKVKKLSNYFFGPDIKVWNQSDKWFHEHYVSHGLDP